MDQDASASPSAVPEQPRRSRAWIIIVVVVLVLCCLCLITAWAAWTYGDAVVQWVNQVLGGASY
jgi:hypothetical protein